ncbi:MAG: hypothetical protein IM638_10415 [Bacteroidetes bacterium]|nr:hypothetical protein [Bacteroidota bacterium]
MSESVPVPFRYNALKHHVQVQRAWIAQFTNAAAQLHELLQLGTSVMDVYEGQFSPSEIAAGIQSQLTAAGHFGRPEFMAWIGTAGYRELTLTDKSRWVLRPGDTYERYIHIHPGRGAAFTFRAKANVLKTALLWRATSHSTALPDTHALNAVRAQLELSPVAEVEDAAHLKLLLGKL